MQGNTILMNSDRVLETILQALGELVEYELAVILRYDGKEGHQVRKAMGPHANRAFQNYQIHLRR